MRTGKRLMGVRAGLAVVLALAMTMVMANEAPLPANAGDVEDSGAEALTGDWGGMRSAWREQGLSVELGYKADLLKATSGGLRRGGQTMWQVDARIAADLGKLWGWEGASAYIQILNDRGGRINETNVGSLMGVSNIEVGTAATHVFHAWLQKSVLDDRLALLVGLYPVDSEFSVVDSAGLLLHPSFGASADFSSTRGPSIFPISAFGMRLRWLSPERAMYAMGALLDGVPGHPHTAKGTHIRFDGGDGSFAITEIGYKPGDSATDEKSKMVADPFYKLAFGLWRYTARVPDLIDVDTFGQPENRRGHGSYVLAEKTVYREASDLPEGLTAFMRFSATDGNSTPIRDALNLGVRYQGLIPGRDDDVAVLGFTRSRLGNKFRDTMEAAGTTVARHEDAFELTYRIQATKWLAVQPMAQRLRRPAADPSASDATVVGVRLEAAL